ncbi:hypothetical protein AAHE18_14G079000 [Arachis hypogaea]
MGLKGYQMGRARQMAELDARRAEVLAKAARLIRKQIRIHLARKEFITLRNATIHIQKIWREFEERIQKKKREIEVTRMRSEIQKRRSKWRGLKHSSNRSKKMELVSDGASSWTERWRERRR